MWTQPSSGFDRGGFSFGALSCEKAKAAETLKKHAN